MKRIEIKGVMYPARLTIGAMVQYKRATGEDFTQFKGDDMEKLAMIIFYAARSACKVDGVLFPYENPEEIMDYLDMESATALLDMGVQGNEGEAEKK